MSSTKGVAFFIERAKKVGYFDKILLKLCEYFRKDNPNFDADKFLDMVADDKLK